MSQQRSPLDRLLGLCLTFCVSAVLLYVGVCLIRSVWPWLLGIVIAVQQGQLGTSWWNICAISIISIIPMTFVAIFLQKRLVTGLLGGALK